MSKPTDPLDSYISEYETIDHLFKEFESKIIEAGVPTGAFVAYLLSDAKERCLLSGMSAQDFIQMVQDGIFVPGAN